ncbi:MAG: hypothetical protein QG594_960 [Bacteroidota bacterium]|nr:hypothetical protein [Bacteroidota bacterium]
MMYHYFKETLKALFQQYFSRVDTENNYRTNFRVINKLGEFIPQHFNGIKWEDIPFGNMWDDYSGRYTLVNAEQRLYVYMGIKKKEWGSHSIFKTGEIRNEIFYDFIELNKAKEEVLAIFKKYKGKTDFLKNIFPEYFTTTV